MQPAAHGHRRFLAIMTTAAAVIVTAALLIALRAAAATPTQDSRANISHGGRDNKNKVIGYVAEAPAVGFTGTWYIVEAGVTVTVIVTDGTKIDGFVGNRAPKIYDWVEAKGKPQDDGTFLARKLRPNKFEPGEVVARLTATTTLTDVLNTYANYSLVLLDTAASRRPNLPLCHRRRPGRTSCCGCDAGRFGTLRLGRS